MRDTWEKTMFWPRCRPSRNALTCITKIENLCIFPLNINCKWFSLQSDWIKKSESEQKGFIKRVQRQCTLRVEKLSQIVPYSQNDYFINVLVKDLYFQFISFSDILNSVIKSNFSRAVMIANCLHNISTFCLVSKVLTLFCRK